jgi:hypothetical protein
MRKDAELRMAVLEAAQAKPAPTYSVDARALARSLLATAACGGLRSTLIADLEGPSFISPTVTHRRMDRRYS